MRRLPLILALLLVTFVMANAQSGQMLFRSPSMNSTHIVFSFAGDLWKVPRAGGTAERLTSAIGNEGAARFSPDGKTLAFGGQYDGNTDVYVIPSEGGEPRRITFHPANEGPVGWTNDGKSILFLSSRKYDQPVGVPGMFTISADGKGMPEQLPFPMAGGPASYSPNGSQIAYMPIAPAFNQWKMYRGGRTTKVWIGNLSDSSVQEIPRNNSNDFIPMWVGNKIYFLSDRNGRNVTLYSYDTRSKAVREEIKNNGFDIKSAQAGPGGIVYEQFGSINIFDPATRRTRRVNINVRGDFLETRPKYERVARRVSNLAISPNGKRAVFEARGEIITVPAKKGNPRNLTNSSGVADRDPAWSPDGKWIAYFSDESGEYALHMKEQSGLGETKKISLGNPSSYFYSPQFSPDGKKIMFRDKRLNIWYATVETGALTKVDTNTYENPFPVMQPNWSPDSKWIVYTKQRKNRLGAVHVYSLETAKATAITDSIGDARFADFDKSGKYIYFTVSTNSGPTTGWLDMSSFPFQTTRSVYAVVLNSKDPSPLAPESDEEAVKEPETKPKKPAPKKKELSVTIDFENIGQRIVALPLPARNYAALVAATPGSFYLAEAVPPSGTSSRPQVGATVHKFDLKSRKATPFRTGVTAFDITPDGKSILIGQFPGRFSIVPTTRPSKPGTGTINVGAMEVYVNPREEWEQMYKEAWRIQRDFFYDPGFHGVDIKKMEARYRPFLNGIKSRADLNYLFREMLGNLTVGHHNS
ncbi:MAG: protease, partial [Pyrinomonadaceae bacterium]|nr:protease [Pyrinomonadaceae bacterium]